MGVLALVVLVAVLGSGVLAPSRTSTAFASAPSGTYAVGSRTEGTVDVITVIPATGGDPIDVVRVPHLEGYAAAGSVSPDASRVALVVADQGTDAQPVASALVVDLTSGAVTRLAEGVDRLQAPIWSPDGATVVVTRTRPSTEDGRGDVAVIRLAADGRQPLHVWSVPAVLGAYPVGFDHDGALLTVVLDGRGSTLYREQESLLPLASGVTRDWKLNADASRLAYIDVSTAGGLRYEGRVLALASSAAGSRVTAQSVGDGAQELGVAWKPGSALPEFGRDHGSIANTSGVQAQSVRGFDLPLSYAPAGDVLAVESWSGTSFADPGGKTLMLVAGTDRHPLPGVTRFYGWAHR